MMKPHSLQAEAMLQTEANISSGWSHTSSWTILIIKDFLLENRMKLNDGKTEFLLMGIHYKLKKHNFDDIKIGKVTIKTAKKAKNLGLIWDNEGKLHNQVNNMCKIGFYHVRKLPHPPVIVPPLTYPTTSNSSSPNIPLPPVLAPHLTNPTHQ